MVETGVSACTDVTGFGLLGHLREMAAASRLDAEIEAASVPVLAAARELAAADAVPGGTLENLAHVSPHVDFAPGLSRVDRLLLADAQTSGGLLISVPPERAERSSPRCGRAASPRPAGSGASPGAGSVGSVSSAEADRIGIDRPEGRRVEWMHSPCFRGGWSLPRSSCSAWP